MSEHSARCTISDVDETFCEIAKIDDGATNEQRIISGRKIVPTFVVQSLPQPAWIGLVSDSVESAYTSEWKCGRG